MTGRPRSAQFLADPVADRGYLSTAPRSCSYRKLAATCPSTRVVVSPFEGGAQRGLRVDPAHRRGQVGTDLIQGGNGVVFLADLVWGADGHEGGPASIGSVGVLGVHHPAN